MVIDVDRFMAVINILSAYSVKLWSIMHKSKTLEELFVEIQRQLLTDKLRHYILKGPSTS